MRRHKVERLSHSPKVTRLSRGIRVGTRAGGRFHLIQVVCHHGLMEDSSPGRKGHYLRFSDEDPLVGRTDWPHPAALPPPAPFRWCGNRGSGRREAPRLPGKRAREQRPPRRTRCWWEAHLGRLTWGFAWAGSGCCVRLPLLPPSTWVTEHPMPSLPLETRPRIPRRNLDPQVLN